MEFQILSILKILSDEYVLLKKWPEFPSFIIGSDIDLLVIDRFESSIKLQNSLRPQVNGKYRLRVTEGQAHTYIDLLLNNEIGLRIDLLDNLDYFTHFSVQSSLKPKIFLTRKTIQIEGQLVYVPSDEFEIMIRYLEYLEWFNRRPDKIKHLNYILENSTEEQIHQLIDNLHCYIRYSHSSWKGTVGNQKQVVIDSRKKAILEIFRLIRFIFQKTIKWQK